MCSEIDMKTETATVKYHKYILFNYAGNYRSFTVVVSIFGPSSV